MLEAAEGFLALGTEWLFTYLIHSSVLITAAWLAVRSGGVRAPESQDLLWKFTALAGVVTATAAVLPRSAAEELRVTATVDHVAEFARPELPTPGMGEIRVVRAPGVQSSGVPFPGLRFSGERVRVVPLRASATPGLLAMRRDMTEPSPECRAALRSGPVLGSGWAERVKAICASSSAIAWYHGLMLLWGAGAGLGLIVHWRGRRELVDLRRSLVTASARADRVLADIVRGTGMRPVLRVSSTLDTPCVIRYDTIALSDRCDRELSDDELGAVLAHEVAHVGRADVIWLAGLRLLTACLWLQPLNRVALRGFLDASELVCDDWALTRTCQPLGLARSISRVAEWALAPRAAMQGVVGMAGADGRTLSGRIRRILSGRKIQEPASRIRRAFAASALVLPLLLLPTVPSPVARRAAIFIQRVAVMDGATVTEEHEAFMGQMHWVGVNSGS